MLEETNPTTRNPLLDTLSVWEGHVRKNFGKRRNLLVRGIPGECNLIAQKRKQQINSASYAPVFKIKMIINTNNRPQKVRAIIDLGATGNFVSKDLARKKGFPRTKKKDPYDLFVVDGSTLQNRGRRVEQETTLLRTRIYQH